jgi:hypothetical protein
MGLDYYPAHISVRSIVVERRKANLAVDRIPHLSTKPGQVQSVFSVCSIVAFARWYGIVASDLSRIELETDESQPPTARS